MKYALIALTGFVAGAAITAIRQDNIVSAATVAETTSASPASEAIPGIQERNSRYRLRKGDTFDLDFAISPEFNQTVAVQPDGYVTLKAVGTIFVEGRTVPELTEMLTAAYAKILHDPIVVIALKDFEKPYFIASGQVAKPGKYDLRSALTVTQAVAIAGGFNDKAKHSHVVLFRPAPSGGFDAKVLDIKKLLASRNLSEDLQLQPGDILYVPQSAFSRIRPYLPITAMGAYLNSPTF
jgi:polysaccharide export outer membrane protein